MSSDPRQEPAGLIVVGASVGGLVAAVIAADRGCRTIVIERGKELGGGAARDAEAIAAAGTRFQRDAGLEDGPERFAADILAASRHHVERAFAVALADQAAPLVEWLADRCGLGMELMAAFTGAGHSVPTLSSRSTARRRPASPTSAGRVPSARRCVSVRRQAPRHGTWTRAW